MERRRTEGETRKGPWTAEEDEILINFVNVNGPRDWSSIRSKGLLPRTGKSCRLRWVNKLRPNLKKGCKFSAEEERVVLDLQATFGNRWATIASYLPGRTDNDVKNFWSTRQKRLARILGSSSQTSCSLKNKSSSKVLLMDSDEASSSHQVFKSSSNKVNEASPSTCRLCSCFCNGSSNDLTAMLQCTPDCMNPQYSTTIELVHTSLPLLMTDHVQVQQVVQPSCSYSPLFGLPPPPPTTAISSSSLHFSLGQHQHYPHPVDFPPFPQETHDDDASYFSMEVAEPISAMDVLACQETLQLVNNIPEIDFGEEVVDQSTETQNYERSDQDNIPVPDNVFNDLPADLFEFLEKSKKKKERKRVAKTALQLPVIDLSSSDHLSTANSIRQACTDSGFFYLINHGIEEDFLRRVFEQSRKFFMLPLEEKMKVALMNYRGYGPLFAEKLDTALTFKGDSKESFDIGPLEGSRTSSDLNQWPSEELLPHWRSTMEEYHRRLLDVGKVLLSFVAQALHLDEDFFIKVGALDVPAAYLRLLHYPGELGSSDEQIYGASAHSDYGMITLLATDGVGGLQVCREKFRQPQVWEDVHHVNGAFIVNIGDMMQRWTNCLFGSTLHRVLPTGQERYSMAFFLDPNPNCVVKCLETCCSESSPPRYPPIRSGDYPQERLRLTYGW